MGAYYTSTLSDQPARGAAPGGHAVARAEAPQGVSPWQKNAQAISKRAQRARRDKSVPYDPAPRLFQGRGISAGVRAW